MRNSNKNKLSDLEECKVKLKALLLEYNCRLMAADEYSHVLLLDEDIDETVNAQN